MVKVKDIHLWRIWKWKEKRKQSWDLNPRFSVIFLHMIWIFMKSLNPEFSTTYLKLKSHGLRLVIEKSGDQILQLQESRHFKPRPLNQKDLTPGLFNSKFRIEKSGFKEFIIQVNLCQKLLFLHQITNNKMTDCSLNYKFNT